MREFFTQTGFEVEEELALYGNLGLHENFGRLVGRYNRERFDVDFN